MLYSLDDGNDTEEDEDDEDDNMGRSYRTVCVRVP